MSGISADCHDIRAGMLQFDEVVSQCVEAIYMTPDLVARRREILHVLALCPGERVLDIGIGPGFGTTDMADAVTPSGQVCGIDLSATMLTLAKARCTAQPWVVLQEANATQLPFPDNSFDVAVSAQVYEYVYDLPTALAELYRVLRPGGRALILDSDWDSIAWHSTDRLRMSRVLVAFNEHLHDSCLPRTIAPKLKDAGFVIENQKVVPLFNHTCEANTASYGLIELIKRFVPGRNGVTKEEAEAWAADLHKLGEEGAYSFTLNQYLFLAVKPG